MGCKDIKTVDDMKLYIKEILTEKKSTNVRCSFAIQFLIRIELEVLDSNY